MQGLHRRWEDRSEKSKQKSSGTKSGHCSGRDMTHKVTEINSMLAASAKEKNNAGEGEYEVLRDVGGISILKSQEGDTRFNPK